MLHTTGHEQTSVQHRLSPHSGPWHWLSEQTRWHNDKQSTEVQQELLWSWQGNCSQPLHEGPQTHTSQVLWLATSFPLCALLRSRNIHMWTASTGKEGKLRDPNPSLGTFLVCWMDEGESNLTHHHSITISSRLWNKTNFYDPAYLKHSTPDCRFRQRSLTQMPTSQVSSR